MKLWDYECPLCHHAEERLVEEAEKDDQYCGRHEIPVLLDRQYASVRSWISDPQRTAQQLQQRSREHTQYCREHGISLNERPEGMGGDAAYRNRQRIKNQRTDVIQQHAQAYEKWGEGLPDPKDQRPPGCDSSTEPSPV